MAVAVAFPIVFTSNRIIVGFQTLFFTFLETEYNFFHIQTFYLSLRNSDVGFIFCNDYFSLSPSHIGHAHREKWIPTNSKFDIEPYCVAHGECEKQNDRRYWCPRSIWLRSNMTVCVAGKLKKNFRLGQSFLSCSTLCLASQKYWKVAKTNNGEWGHWINIYSTAVDAMMNYSDVAWNPILFTDMGHSVLPGDVGHSESAEIYIPYFYTRFRWHLSPTNEY